MLNIAIDIAQKTGDIILSEKVKLVIEKKSRREIVTNADIAAEKYITQSILSKFPSHYILGEESVVKGKDYQIYEDLWVVDPIDGTTNFAQGMPEYGVSIGFYHQLKPVIGVIFFPEKNMLFTAEAGKGSFLNGKKIHVSYKSNIQDVVCGALFSYNTDENIAIFDIGKKLYPQIKTMRFLGSAVLDLCFASCGYLEATFGLALKPWDMAAGYLIAKEAGAVISTLKGGKWSLFQPEILVANPIIHPQLVKIFNQILP